MAVGGGSGGHVTPVIAVLRELKRLRPDCELRFWCDKKFSVQAQLMISGYDASIPVSVVLAGKLRRYNNLSLIRQLLRPVSIVLPNIRDAGLTLIGVLQALIKLMIWRPDIVFCKGGYVCLPVGLAAYILKIPLIIHDSDAHPGLTNRLLARFATRILTGAPLSYYNYDPKISHYVGIPISNAFRPYTDDEKVAAKIAFGFDPLLPLVVATGGGLGARRINDAVVSSLPDLLKISNVLLISGSGALSDNVQTAAHMTKKNFQLRAFISEGVDQLFGASDVVITRAGATTLLELAASATPTLIIPNGYLTGGHQLKNAAVYGAADAAVILSEDDMMSQPAALSQAVTHMLESKESQERLSKNIYQLARPDAAYETAKTIIDVIT